MNALFGPLGGVVWLAVLVLSSLAIVVTTFKQSLVVGEKAPLQAWRALSLGVRKQPSFASVARTDVERRET